METNQNQAQQNQPTQMAAAEAMTDKQMLEEIYKNTLKTKRYMQWSLYITLILVVLPLLAALFIVPFAMKSLTAAYITPLQGLQ